MTALDLLDTFRARGVLLEIEGDRLMLDGPAAAITDDLIELARQHKADLLTALREAAYGRVTCLRCSRLTRAGVCRALSTRDTTYRPLEYTPVMLWRRCEHYRERTER